jgi:prepilin-type N-terminal cleavage/methylation domain-containing protein
VFSKSRLFKKEQGFSLLEVLISIAILGILLAGFIPAMMGSTRISISVDEKVTAKNLAESQMEYVLDQGYHTSYSPSSEITSQYPGYTVDDPVTVTGFTQRDGDIQSITIIVRRNGVITASLTSFKIR